MKHSNTERIAKQVILDKEKLFMRVRSWLRINAGGVLNTCKSNENYIDKKLASRIYSSSGGRVSNA